LARDEEDIEYIALSYGSSSPDSKSAAPRLILKQLKFDVHEKTGMTAETPKLSLPKPLIRVGGITRVRTDWNDVHVYVLSPWVRRLVVERKSLVTVQSDLIPLLVSRQFKGVVATFGSTADPEVVDDILATSPDLVKEDLAGPMLDGDNSMRQRPRSSGSSDKSVQSDQEYTVRAHVQKEAVRASTIASYLHASREVLTRASAASDDPKSPCLNLPPDTQVRSKFNSILLPGFRTGEKVTLKSTSVGRNCKLGAKCRLNNVVVMDGAIIGDNVILQNSIVGSGCRIGDNCNFNDCQFAPGKEIPSGEKAKGDAFS